MNRISQAQTADPTYRSLYKLGGAAAFIVVGLTLSEVVGFTIFRQPATAAGWFELFQGNTVLGLLGVGSPHVRVVRFGISGALRRAQKCQPGWISSSWGYNRMKADHGTPRTIDQYIAGFPDEVREILQQVRKTISEAAPDAEEAIKYRMPTFTLRGNLVHFAAYKRHLGFYPTSTGIEAFKNELSAYKSSKGAVQFPLDKPIPFDLIGRIVRFRVEENLARAAAKGKKR